MILLADNEGPDAVVQTDQGLTCPHMPEYMFSLSAAHMTAVFAINWYSQQ